jgi:hypothetical protein
MKKNKIVVLATLALVFSLSSCSKSYNCHCVYKNNGTITREEDNTINEGKKEKSEAKCNEMDSQTSTTLNGNTYVTSTECELQ